MGATPESLFCILTVEDIPHLFSHVAVIEREQRLKETLDLVENIYVKIVTLICN
jgi:hypothetical protein